MTKDITTGAGNLPAEPNSFIGRERDTAELASLLGKVRMVTLCGPGGIGKTRLALRLAAGLAADYADGAWLADLAAADGPDQVVPLVAAAFGIRRERDRPLADTLTEALRPRSMLLILDTCEHLVDACAELVQQLLASCASLRVIATSREPLRVRGEAAWRVPPLGLPPGPQQASLLSAQIGRDDLRSTDELAGCEAVRLFAERAVAVRPDFRLQPGNIAAVAAVCRTLDGIPLAIELAAARIRALSAEQIAVRLADRFALLASGDRAAPRRQQTLRAAVDWSYDLLTEAEQVLLRRLSVFYGWNLEMAERVCSDDQIGSADVLDLLTALIDKSLVNVDWVLHGQARYRLLDTVREYAAGQAEARGEAPGLRAAHRDYMLAVLEESLEKAFVRGELPWPERVAMFRRMVAERANIRAALACCAERGDAEQGLRICLALRTAWLTGGDASEGAAWLDRLLAIDTEVSPALRGRALAVRAELAFMRQDAPAAGEFAGECLKVSRACGDGNQAAALRIMALLALGAGQFDAALEAADAAIAAARAAADEFEAGVALIARATVVARQGDIDQAQRAFEVALDELGQRGWARASALYGLGRLAVVRRDDARALEHYRAALVLYRQVDARSEMVRCLAAIGWVALSERNLALARASLTESLQLSLAGGQRQATARGLSALSAFATAAGDLASALRLAGTSLVLHEVIGEEPSAGALRRLDELLAAASGRLGGSAAEELLAQGRAMSPEAAARLVPPVGPDQLTDPQAPQAGPVPVGQDQQTGGAAPAAQGQVQPGQAGSGGLTARELQIAALIARGLSNQAIADELVIRPSTAARHVANILAKFGFNSRTQVAAWVAERQPSDEG